MQSETVIKIQNSEGEILWEFNFRDLLERLDSLEATVKKLEAELDA